MMEIWRLYVDHAMPRQKKWERILAMRTIRLFIRQHDAAAFLQDVFTLFTNSFKVVICDVSPDDPIEDVLRTLNQDIADLIAEAKLPATTVQLNGELLNAIDYMLDAVALSMTQSTCT